MFIPLIGTRTQLGCTLLTGQKRCGIIYNMTDAKKSPPSQVEPPCARVNFRAARFLTSASRLSECPPDEGWEVAVAGRSNAGKSSAINCLTGNSKLARTSKTPGRTQLLNFFSLSSHQRLVDLPGYGYAKVPEAVKRSWGHRIEQYLQNRRSLRGLILVMDVRHPLTEFDWSVAADMPIHILLTKADKLKKGPAKNTLLKVRGALAGHADLVSVQLFSALKKTGLEEVQGVLQAWLEDTSVLDEEA